MEGTLKIISFQPHYHVSIHVHLFNMEGYYEPDPPLLSCGLVINLSALRKDNKHVRYIDLTENHYECAVFLAKSYLQRHDKERFFLLALA